MPRCPARYYDSQPTYRLIRWVKAYDQSNWDVEVKGNCAGEALGRRDETVIPDLIALIDASGDSVVRFIAMQAVCGEGHSGSSAIPYLLRKLPSDNSVFTPQAYEALACMGREAKSAIPYLIQKSADDNRAVELLGKLAQHYPKIIVPHLIQLLDNPARANEAAGALGQAGSGARPALDALRSHLAVAVTGNQDSLAARLISAVGKVGDPSTSVPELLPLLDKQGARKAAAQALGEIGPPAAAAVPRLISRLDDPEVDPKERHVDIAALGSIDTHSRQVLDVLLREAASDKDAGGNYTAASDLSKIDPLPKDFAPQLISALESLPAKGGIRYELAVALDHTHTGNHTVGSLEPSPPSNIGALIDGIWALVLQAQPVTLEDVFKHLGLKREDYRLEGTAAAYSLDARWSAYHGRLESVPISHVTFYGVLSHFDFQPTPQEVRINLNERFCLAASSVVDRIPGAAGSVIDNRTVFQVKGLPGDGSLAHESSLNVAPLCSGYIEIVKNFDRKVVIDPAFVDGTAK
jgi:HEAT repeat protein